MMTMVKQIYTFLIMIIVICLHQHLVVFDPKVREDIIDRLIKLQQYEIKTKDIKIIDEDILDEIKEELYKKI